MSRFEPTPFRPDGGVSVVGLPIMLLIVAAASVGVGWLASFIGQWFYLIVLFPAGMGLALFFAAILGAKIAKLRSWPIAALTGLAAAAIALGSMHYFDYLRAMQGLVELPGMNKAIGFLDYLDLSAKVGIRIGRGGGGLNIGYWGTWIYWTVECLAVAVIAILGFGVQVTEPFCSACDRWKDSTQLGTLKKKGVNVAAFVENGEIERLKEHDPAPAGNDLVLTVYTCPRCRDEGPVVVRLEEVKKNDKGEESKVELVNSVYPGEALRELEALFDFGSHAPPRKRLSRGGDDY